MSPLYEHYDEALNFCQQGGKCLRRIIQCKDKGIQSILERSDGYKVLPFQTYKACMLNPLGLSGEPKCSCAGYVMGLDAYYTNQKSGTPHCVECRTLLEKSGGYLLSRWTQYHRRGRA